MASGQRSNWPLVLFLGLCVSLLVGGAVAVADPSESGRPSWHDGDPQHMTGTVLEIDRANGTITLEKLVTWTPAPEAGIGSIVVRVADVGELAVGDTIDLDVVRDDGAWTGTDVTVLDTD